MRTVTTAVTAPTGSLRDDVRTYVQMFCTELCPSWTRSVDKKEKKTSSVYDCTVEDVE